MKKVYCDYCRCECRSGYMTDKDGQEYHSKCYDKIRK